MPLAVDMDGTLVCGDTLWEACVKLVVHKPWFALLLPFWLFRGKAGFKAAISRHVTLNPAGLAYHAGVVNYLQQQKQQGRGLWLVTAANHSIADGVAAHHHGLFDGVLASDGEHNLSGRHKAATLVSRFGEKGFVYAGNAPVDLKVWQHAAGAVVVNGADALVDKAKTLTQLEHVIREPVARSVFARILRAIRIHQWTKNLLLFVPLVLSHTWGQVDYVLTILLAFIAFCCSASAIYIINDFVDLEADRQHPQKRHRPFAAGILPLYWGVILAPLLLAIAFTLALHIDLKFTFTLLAYIVLTLAYSFLLKPYALLDVLALTSLYTLRIIGGAVAIHQVLSYWLLAFSMFIFLSLALSKRYSELHNLKQLGTGKQRARGYHVEDLPIIIIFGISSGYLAVLVTVLYINDLQASALYTHPLWLWPVAMAVLYWISRIWLLAHRGELHEDPVLFAIHDRASYVVTLLVAISLLLAI
ncbi:MAG: UbiA family prenyltransferase [Gammaproteobacteria bacterium]|nr:UbiA family prenyltransferase [Gammaproteobacteria bacterium]